MKPQKLHFLLFFSIAGSTSAVSLPRKAIYHAPFYRRDHGNPFLNGATPQSTTSIAPAPTPTPVVTPTIATAPPATATPSTLPISTSRIASSSLPTSSAIATKSSTTEPISNTSPISSSFSSRSTPTTALTPIAVAPVQTSPVDAPSQSSSSSDRTWVIVGIFALSFILVGLVVFIIMSSRRRARRQRAKGLKREVELMDVGDVERAGGSGAAESSADVGKVRSGVVQDLERMRMERKRELEGLGSGHGKGDDEWEQALPAYAR